jgi:hypothetical protein
MKYLLTAILVGFVVGCNNEVTSPNPNPALFETPKLLAEMAAVDAQAYRHLADACEARNFNSYLSIFTASPRIREKYSAREVIYESDNRTQKVLASENYYYPLVIARDTLLATSGFPVALEITTPTPTKAIVRWKHKPLDPTATFDDAQHKAVKENGELTFASVKGCWRLVSDRRFK